MARCGISAETQGVFNDRNGSHWCDAFTLALGTLLSRKGPCLSVESVHIHHSVLTARESRSAEHLTTVPAQSLTVRDS